MCKYYRTPNRNCSRQLDVGYKMNEIKLRRFLFVCLYNTYNKSYPVSLGFKNFTVNQTPDKNIDDSFPFCKLTIPIEIITVVGTRKMR